MKRCKLYTDISSSVVTGDECRLTDINIGIRDYLYVYNLEDIVSLDFVDDARADNSLFINTINTTAPFYQIECANISYQETYNDQNYTHEITAYIRSVRTEIEEVLKDAIHGKYVVAFKVIGEEDYKLIGWKEGLSLDEVLNISTDNNAYTLTFTGTTTYPHMTAYYDNFDLSKKVFEPIFTPTFYGGKFFCDDQGYAIAMYAEKTNVVGQPLDDENHLCEFSGKKQDAYKWRGAPNRIEYNIIGTYETNAEYNGKSVRVYDRTLCNNECSISVSPMSIDFDSNNRSRMITITSDGNWKLMSSQSTVTLSRVQGGSGTTDVWVYSEAKCGTDVLTFRNIDGGCSQNLIVNNNTISINSPVYYPNRTTSVTLSPIVCGVYRAESSEGTVSIDFGNGTFTVSGIAGQDEEKTVTVTLYYQTETKNVQIIIAGADSERGARAITTYCEIDEEI